MSQLVKCGDEYYEVLGEEGDFYVCSLCGGGFVHRIPKTAAEPCQYESNWAPGKVAVNTEEWFDCMMDHSYRWNGWRDPYFTKEELFRFLAAEGYSVGKETEDCIQLYYEDPDDEMNQHEANKYEIDGQELWNINGWCFVSKADCEQTEEVAG